MDTGSNLYLFLADTHTDTINCTVMIMVSPIQNLQRENSTATILCAGHDAYKGVKDIFQGYVFTEICHLHVYSSKCS